MYTRNYQAQRSEPPKPINEKETPSACQEKEECAADGCVDLCVERENGCVCADETEKPCEVCEDFHKREICEETPQKCRYRAIRVPRTVVKDAVCDIKEECCEEKCAKTEWGERECEIDKNDCEKVAPICPRQPFRNPISSLFSSLCADEMLVLALVVLLLLDGGDEILIFALLFVLR